MAKEWYFERQNPLQERVLHKVNALKQKPYQNPISDTAQSHTLYNDWKMNNTIIVLPEDEA